MPLRRSPCLTPKSLFARRANALHSTGPRTPRGKARVSLNALRHGQYAARSARLRERLIRAGYERQEELYGRIRSKIAQTFGTPDRAGRQDADRLANVVWCRATRPQAGRPVDFPNFPATEGPQLTEAGQEASMGTKLESLTIQKDSLWRVPSGQQESAAPAGEPAAGKVAQRSPGGQLKVSQEGLNWPKRLRHHGHLERHASPGNPARLGCHLGGEPAVVRFKFGAQDDWRRIGLTFWVQRKAYCTLERGVRVLVGREKPAPPEWNEYLERTVRSKAFRLRKPNPRERWRFSLEPDGKPDWTREPWKSARARVEAQEQSRRRKRG